MPLITSKSQPQTQLDLTAPINLNKPQVRIAVARDKAFSFYYQDNFDLLTKFGAELVFWSPLTDRSLPDDIHGLYFGGGFPEVFAQQLAANQNVLSQLQQIIATEIPVYAECGGLMYLCQKLIDLEGQSHSLLGIIPTTVTMQAKLTLGYRKAIALQASSLVLPQQSLIGHEFHRSRLITNSHFPQWQLQGVHKSSLVTNEGWNTNQVHASYLHLHWGANPEIPQRFIQSCRNYKI